MDPTPSEPPIDSVELNPYPEVHHGLEQNLSGEADGSELEFAMLDPRKVIADRLAGLIFASILAVCGLVSLLVFSLTYGAVDWFWGLIVGVVLIFLVCFFIYVIFWPAIEYRNISWRLSPAGLEIRQGVFWKHQISVPLNRVQHTDIQQGPMQRYFELGTLVVNTAGTENASVPLAGLSHETALELRDELIRQREAADAA